MKCTLCNYALNDRARHYAEGDFCDDVAGCRRRALKRYSDVNRLAWALALTWRRVPPVTKAKLPIYLRNPLNALSEYLGEV